MVTKTSAAAALALALVGATPGLASTVYDNTTTDTFLTLVYSANGASHLGDTVTLEGFDRRLTSASVQFYNLGAAGSFSAMLAFWNVGAPVGAQIGSSLLNGIAIGVDESLTVTFGGLDLLVPDTLVFTVEVTNATPGVDVGLNLFEPPTIGTSDNRSIIIGTTAGSVTSFTSTGEGNLFLRLEATSVPAPSTTAMFLGAALCVASMARRRRQAAAARSAT